MIFENTTSKLVRVLGHINGHCARFKAGEDRELPSHLIEAAEEYGLDEIGLTYPVESFNVTLSKTKLTAVGGSGQAKVENALPKDAVLGKLLYSSTNKDAVTVNANGKFTAVADGSAIIKVEDKRTGVTADSGVISVEIPLPELTGFGVTLSERTLTGVGSTGNAGTTNVKPSGAVIGNVTYSSTDESVLTVKNSGVYEAVGAGTARVSAKDEDTGVSENSQVVEVIVESDSEPEEGNDGTTDPKTNSTDGDTTATAAAAKKAKAS